jgi:hypothetical protein
MLRADFACASTETARNHSYRFGGRQRFIRFGQTPERSLEAARIRAKDLRSIVDQGRDPARENRGREIPPVENLIQYIAENLVTKS